MRKYFITGLVFLLPLAVTIAIAAFVVNFLTQPFMGIVENFFLTHKIFVNGFIIFSAEQVTRFSSQIIILFGLFGLTVLLGALTRWFVIHYLISLGDYILHRIPIINSLYKTSQDVIKTLFSSQSESFQQVVMVPFPTPNIFCMGLVTRESPPACSKSASAQLISVFVPTTPNPTSGYLLMFKKEDIHYLDLKVEDAVKFIISCGVIYPGAPELQNMDPQGPFQSFVKVKDTFKAKDPQTAQQENLNSNRQNSTNAHE